MSAAAPPFLPHSPGSEMEPAAAFAVATGILGLIGAPICLLSREGRILFENAAMRQCAGAVAAAELREGRAFGEFVHPDDRAAWEERLAWLTAEPGRCARLRLRWAGAAAGHWIRLESHFTNALEERAVGGILVASSVRPETPLAAAGPVPRRGEMRRDPDRADRPQLDDLSERDLFLAARLEVQRILLRGGTVREQMPEILAILGRTVRCSRALYFEVPAERSIPQRLVLVSEWLAPGAASRFGTGDSPTYSIGVLDGVQRLENGDVYTIRRCEANDQAEYMDRLGVKSSIQTPIRVQGRLFAMLGCQHLEIDVDWSESEKDQLQDLAAALTFALQREATTAALEGEKARLDVLLQSLSEGVIATDAAGRITLANTIAEQILGWREDELCGRELTRYFELKTPLPGDPPTLQQEPLPPDAVQSVLTGGKTLSNLRNVWALQRDGGRVQVACSTSPLRGAPGAIAGVVRVFRDVTEEERVQAELVRIGKLEGLGAIAAGIAHDFNNILTALNGNVSLALLHLHRDERAAGVSRLAEAERAGQRARELTAQMLTFTKGGVPIRGLTRLDEIIRESISFALHGSSSRSVLRLEDNLPAIEADAGQIHQVIHNLAINAVQAMERGGTLTVEARSLALIDDPGTPSLPPGRYVEVVLTDTGPGIDAAVLSKIFDPFFTTKPTGSGLGLATAYAIVKNHGGRLSYQPSTAGGASFRVLLPAAGSVPELASEPGPRPPVAAVPLQGMRVLVLDDDDDVRRLTTRALDRLGCRVAQAATAAEALDRLRAGRAAAEPFDLAILDLTIPGGPGGFEVMRTMRKEDPALHSIACSGYIVDSIRSDYIEQGFSAILAKPFRVPELAAVIEGIFRTES